MATGLRLEIVLVLMYIISEIEEIYSSHSFVGCHCRPIAARKYRVDFM